MSGRGLRALPPSKVSSALDIAECKQPSAARRRATDSRRAHALRVAPETARPPSSGSGPPDLSPAEEAELERLIRTSPAPSRDAASRARQLGPAAGLDQAELRQLAELHRLEPLVVPSGQPLCLVDGRTRAIAALLALGENATLVGRMILGPPVHTAGRRARRMLLRARQAIAPAPLRLSTRRRPRLVRLVPDHRRRWVLLLRAAGVFDEANGVKEIATALRMDRATVYRDLARVTTTLTAHFAARKEAKRA